MKSRNKRPVALLPGNPKCKGVSQLAVRHRRPGWLGQRARTEPFPTRSNPSVEPSLLFAVGGLDCCKCAEDLVLGLLCGRRQTLLELNPGDERAAVRK